MKRLLALFAALAFALTRLRDRLRAWWWRRQRLPTVREALADGTLPPARRFALATPPEDAAEDEATYRSISSSVRVLRGGRDDRFVVAKTTILPPPLRPLSVVRPHRILPELGILRPQHFGVDPDEETARVERLELPRREPPPEREYLERPLPKPGPEQLAVLEPRYFGLGADGRPAVEEAPLPLRRPPKLSKASATFVARYVEPEPADAYVSEVPVTFGESVATWAARQLDRPTPGPSGDIAEWEQDEEVGEQLGEVREQFNLRRDISRAEFDTDDLGTLMPQEGLSFGAMKTYSGLTFENFQPEPHEPLRMRLENPPPDMRPPTEDAAAQLAWLIRAVREQGEE